MRGSEPWMSESAARLMPGIHTGWPEVRLQSIHIRGRIATGMPFSFSMSLINLVALVEMRIRWPASGWRHS